jgi:hydroxyacylglutathione hydrolase
MRILMTHTIYPIKAFADNYIWAIVNDQNQSVVIVDPGDANPVMHFIEQHQLSLTAILVTHHHQDHCGGVAILREKFALKIFGPKHADIAATHVVGEATGFFFVDADLSFQVLEIPGHTLDHVAFYCAEEKMLFCGDTLFSAGCGRVFEGTYEQMWRSLQKLTALPDDTRLYCGHEYTASNLKFALAVEPENQDMQRYQETVLRLRMAGQPTLPALLSREKKMNPFLRAAESSVIASVRKKTGRSLNDAKEVFAELRQWKNKF